MLALETVKNAISSLAIFFAGFAALVGTTDLFLSNSQRDYLNRLILKLWYFLAEKNPRRRIERLKTPQLFRNLVVFGPMLACIVQIGLMNGMADGIAGIFVGAFKGLIIGSIYTIINLTIFRLFPALFELLYSIYIYILSGNHVFFILLKSFLSGLIAIIYLSVLIAFSSFVFMLTHSDIISAMAYYPPIFVLNPIFGGITAASSLFVDLFYISVLVVILRFAEFFIRKIAEYDKGVVLGASAVVGGIGEI
jgi:hypothetical protein